MSKLRLLKSSMKQLPLSEQPPCRVQGGEATTDVIVSSYISGNAEVFEGSILLRGPEAVDAVVVTLIKVGKLTGMDVRLSGL